MPHEGVFSKKSAKRANSRLGRRAFCRAGERGRGGRGQQRRRRASRTAGLRALSPSPPAPAPAPDKAAKQSARSVLSTHRCPGTRLASRRPPGKLEPACERQRQPPFGPPPPAQTPARSTAPANPLILHAHTSPPSSRHCATRRSRRSARPAEHHQTIVAAGALRPPTRHLIHSDSPVSPCWRMAHSPAAVHNSPQHACFRKRRRPRCTSSRRSDPGCLLPELAYARDPLRARPPSCCLCMSVCTHSLDAGQPHRRRRRPHAACALPSTCRRCRHARRVTQRPRQITRECAKSWGDTTSRLMVPAQT